MKKYSHQQTPVTSDTTNQIAPKNESTNKKEEQITKLKEKYRDQLYDTYKTKANKIITFYILAQRLFYNEEYEHALSAINKAIEIQINADLLALRGSIYLGMDETDNFVRNWKKALQIDPDVPLPRSDYIIKKLHENGLINKNEHPKP